MILTKKDLKEYLNADKLRYKDHKKSSSFIRDFIKCVFMIQGEEYYVRKYLRTLRHYEFYLNNSKHNFLFWILCKFYSFRHKYLSNQYHIYIGANKVGKGLYIPHFSSGIICNCASMGENCIISSGVIVGNKGGQENIPIVGNNVELCIGCKIIGKIKIGDNAIVAPNSVVIKDVPDNAIVSGIPAIVIKFKS